MGACRGPVEEVHRADALEDPEGEKRPGPAFQLKIERGGKKARFGGFGFVAKKML